MSPMSRDCARRIAPVWKTGKTFTSIRKLIQSESTQIGPPVGARRTSPPPLRSLPSAAGRCLPSAPTRRLARRVPYRITCHQRQLRYVAARKRAPNDGRSQLLSESCGLQPELAVGRLPASLPVLAIGFGLEFRRGRRAVLVDVAAGKACAVRPVPVFFEKHRTLTAGAGSRWCYLHFVRYLRRNKKEPFPLCGWPFHAPPRLAVGFG